MAQAEAVGEAELLRTSYHQWKFCQKLLRTLMTRVLDAIKPQTQEEKIKKIKKIKSVFGRWLQSIQHFDRDELDVRYPLFPRAGESLQERASTSELEFYLTDGLKVPKDRAQEIVKEMLTLVEEFPATDAVDNNEVAVQYANNPDGDPARGGQIVVGDFHTPYRPRISCFVNNFGELNTALVCLRYAPLAEFLGGESGMSVTAINAMYDIGQARHVGFSSPLNCRLLGRPDVKFCSLFHDTDAAFDSLGNFFNINLADHPGGWILDPPFVEPVMEATASRIVQLLDETEQTKPGAFWFFITFPNWEDNQGWQILDESRWKVSRIDVDKRRFLQQDHYGDIYRPDIPLQVFILGKLPDSVDLIALRNRITDGNDLDRVRRDWLIACDIEG